MYGRNLTPHLLNAVCVRMPPELLNVKDLSFSFYNYTSLIACKSSLLSDLKIFKLVDTIRIT